MSIKRAFARKDTFITEKSLTANNGLNPVIETWNEYDPIAGKKKWARILIQFTLSSLTANIDNGIYADPRTDSTVSAYVQMTNAKHDKSIPENYNLWLLPLTATWTEGRGLDSDNFANSGFADAVSATNSVAWTDNDGMSGGEVYLGADTRIYDSNSGNQYFEHGEEDLKIDVTEYLKEILDGNSGDFGFMIRMSDAQEAKDATEASQASVNVSTTSSSYAYKKFYGRETNTRNAPFLQLQWDSSIKDDRPHITFSKTGNLFFYNYVNGELIDLNGTAGHFPGYVDLSANGEFITTSGLTASRHSKGVYKINIGTATDEDGNALTGINIGASSATSFVDSWTITSAGEYRSNDFNFTPKLPTAESGGNITISRYPAKLVNLLPEYEKGTVSKVRLYIRDRSTVITPLTGTTTAMNTYIVKNGTYEIREKDTDLIEIPEQTLSYDANGNWFELDTNNLYPNIDYKVVLKLQTRGDTYWYDNPDTWTFRVR